MTPGPGDATCTVPTFTSTETVVGNGSYPPTRSPLRCISTTYVTGNVLAAATPGVSIKDLMSRMGHASPAAALRYQHATKDRDATIARALAVLIQPDPASVVSIDDARR